MITALGGMKLPDWLAARCPAEMPPYVRALRAGGIYAAGAAKPDLRTLREYAAHWIAAHRLLAGDTQAGH